MRVLELGESASMEQIKRGYRRLAQRYHPDKHGGDVELARQFAKISHAYRCLMRLSRGAAAGQLVGRCAICGEFDEISRGRDGRFYCSQCVFRPMAGRLLPLPPLIVAKCLGTFCTLGASVYLLILALTAGRTQEGALLAALAFGAGVIGLVWLGWTSIHIAHCLNARERLMIENYLSAVRGFHSRSDTKQAG